MYSFRKIFFSESRAKSFGAYLESQGIKDFRLYLDRDGFGQNIYGIMWNVD